jgi:hypothetical protein
MPQLNLIADYCRFRAEGKAMSDQGRHFAHDGIWPVPLARVPLNDQILSLHITGPPESNIAFSIRMRSTGCSIRVFIGSSAVHFRFISVLLRARLAAH